MVQKLRQLYTMLHKKFNIKQKAPIFFGAFELFIYNPYLFFELNVRAFSKGLAKTSFCSFVALLKTSNFVYLKIKIY